MNNQQSDMQKKLADQGARMTPLAFEERMMEWFRANGKRLSTFAGGEDEAKKMLAGLFYAASRVPQLMECSTTSLGDCLMQSAQLGLYPGAMQHCGYLPFMNNKKGCREAQFVPMYQGLVELAYGTGCVKDIQADIVYEADEFEFEKGTGKHLRHRPFMGPDKERGQMVAVYCLVETAHGSHFEVKSIQWVNSIRNKSKNTGGDSPWNTSWEEMAKKSVFKHAAKWIPKDQKLARAIELDNEDERSDLAKPIIVDVKMPGDEPAAARPAAAPRALPEQTGIKMKMPAAEPTPEFSALKRNPRLASRGESHANS